MRDEFTAEERQVAEMLNSVGLPRHRRKVSPAPQAPRRWLTAASLIGLVALVAAGAILLPQALGHRPSQVQKTPTTTPSTTRPAPALYLGAGASLDSGQEQWVLGQSGLAVSRDGGAQWSQLTLPAPPSTILAVAVLPSETVVASSATPQNSVTISTMSTAGTAWQEASVPIGAGQVGTIEIVDADGVLSGMLVVLTTSSNFSSGDWLAAPTGNGAWRVVSTPVGGTVTAVGGTLWLVGGAAYQDIYSSSNGGNSWQPVSLPLSVGTPVAYGPVQEYRNGVALIATLDNSDETQVVIGSPAGSMWIWSDGPTLRVGAQYSGAVPSSSLADGVLWMISWAGEVSRVNLATGVVSQVIAHGFPASGSPTISAISGTAATGTYSSFACPMGKSSCTPESGVVTTTDGGSYWTAIADPLVN